MAAEPKNLIEAIRYFEDPDVCVNFVAAMRWPNGVACPTCGSLEVSYMSTRRIWRCKTRHEKWQFSVKVGTIFEDSAIGLDKWLTAMWMIANAKNGISSYEVSRSIGVSQKSAWHMMHRIRLAMQDGSFDKPMRGEVEVDETFVGGKARNMHKAKRAEKIHGTGGMDKSMVVGLLERSEDGQSVVRLKHVDDRKRRTLSGVVREHVEFGSVVYTDSLPSYRDLREDFVHEFIDHTEKYVEGRVSTNGIENFWSLLKRSLGGTYVSVEPFHLFRYLDEQAFRFNTRAVTDGERFLMLMRRIIGKRLTWAELTSATPTTTPA